jgi:hypothetical protein
MSNYIDFITFKQILNAKNILLFDAHYRIAHFRLNSLLKNMEQNGGSNNTTNTNSHHNPNNKLNYFSEKIINNHLFDKLISSLLENNVKQISYIINLINN